MTTPAPAARAALLRRLPADGFVPPADLAPWSAASRAAAFAAEVEAFAAAFWSLAPEERRKRFDALWSARYGPGAARLGELEGGLDVESGAGADPRVEELAKFVRTLFVLPPRARAVRRVEALGSDFRPKDWAAVAPHLLRNHLPLARLEPEWFDWVAVGRSPTPIPAPEPAAGQELLKDDLAADVDRRNAILIFQAGCVWVPLAVLACAVLRTILM